MSFKLTIEVPDTKLAATLKALNGHKVVVENVHDAEPKKAANGKTLHSRAESHLTMTGKTPQKGSQLFKARDVFEKLEKRMGIGNVNVAAFRIELTKKKLSKGLAQRCVTERVLDYIE
jgi:hypothetical protein